MIHVDFADALWKKQGEYRQQWKNTMSRFHAFQNVFSYFQEGQTVAQLGCGSILDDLFLTMARVGREGRVILIDENPAFAYNRAVSILGEGILPQEKEFYIQSEEGIQSLRDLFAQANIEVYVQHLPPYPHKIKDESIDHVMAINAAFELMATRLGGEPADPAGLVTETYKKLRNGGSLIVQGLEGFDIEMFSTFVYEAIENGLGFEEDFSIMERLGRHQRMPGAGYWGRWVKNERSPIPMNVSQAFTDARA